MGCYLPSGGVVVAFQKTNSETSIQKPRYLFVSSTYATA